jgi:S-adenosylmethionine hydrolase
LVKYTEYLRENLEKVTEYAEYVAETVNSNLLLEDEAGIPAEDLKDETKDVTVDVVDADGNVITGKPEDVKKDIKLAGKGDAAGEEIREDAGIPAEALKDTSKDVTVDVVDADGNVITGTPEDVEKNLELAGKGDAAGKQVDQMEAYIKTLTYLMKNTHGLRRLGSAAVDLAYVACGKFDAFFETGLHAWDVAAGCLLVQEAGGTVYDFKGETNYVFGKSITAGNVPVNEILNQLVQSNFK